MCIQFYTIFDMFSHMRDTLFSPKEQQHITSHLNQSVRNIALKRLHQLSLTTDSLPTNRRYRIPDNSTTLSICSMPSSSSAIHTEKPSISSCEEIEGTLPIITEESIERLFKQIVEQICDPYCDVAIISETIEIHETVPYSFKEIQAFLHPYLIELKKPATDREPLLQTFTSKWHTKFGHLFFNKEQIAHCALCSYLLVGAGAFRKSNKTMKDLLYFIDRVREALPYDFADYRLSQKECDLLAIWALFPEQALPLTWQDNQASIPTRVPSDIYEYTKKLQQQRVDLETTLLSKLLPQDRSTAKKAIDTYAKKNIENFLLNKIKLSKEERAQALRVLCDISPQDIPVREFFQTHFASIFQQTTLH